MQKGGDVRRGIIGSGHQERSAAIVYFGSSAGALGVMNCSVRLCCIEDL